jgi:pilus assembly protein Flp/PilA
LVEYALILVLVAIVVIVILAILGPAIGNVFSNIVNAV